MWDTCACMEVAILVWGMQDPAAFCVMFVKWMEGSDIHDQAILWVIYGW